MLEFSPALKQRVPGQDISQAIPIGNPGFDKHHQKRLILGPADLKRGFAAIRGDELETKFVSSHSRGAALGSRGEKELICSALRSSSFVS
ncbi:MAG TPA: hypothetical protein VGM54_15310 [Chthoniobacter sp.]|jgi:hypothetical protein